MCSRCRRCGSRNMRRRLPRLQRARRATRKRQQRDVARALDGHAQPALVPRTNSGHAPRQNLPALLHELRQNVRALVVDEVHLLHAELADFLLAEILPLATPRPARTTATRPATFTTRPAVSARAAMPAVSAAFTTRSSAGR